MAVWESNVAHSFPTGTKIGVYRRVGDTFLHDALGKPLETAKVEDDGTVSLKGLPYVPLWVAAEVPAPTDDDDKRTEWRAVRAHAKRETADERAPKLSEDDRLRQASEFTGAAARTVEQDKQGKKGKDIDPTVPVGQRQQDMHKDTPQRSSTPYGIATPVDPDEVQPYPSQDDVPANKRQRSDTPLGRATVLYEPNEEPPRPSQDDVKKGTEQRSDTPEGEATPIDTRIRQT